jgi:ssDNA-binding Zn-finger/Zn-ribbon topoisomerase 1
MVLGLALTFVGKRVENALVQFIRGRRTARHVRRAAAAEFPRYSGAIEAPACPQCGSKMVLREAKRGTHAGRSFWGCPRYPDCRGTRDV